MFSRVILVTMGAIMGGVVLHQASASISASDISLLRSFKLDAGNVYSKSPELSLWVKSQNDRTRLLLDAHPLLAPIKARFQELVPTNPLAPYYLVDREIAVKAGSLISIQNGIETVLVDKASLNGSAVADYRVSPDGSKVIYAVALNGSDSNYWSFYDLATGKTLPDAPIRVRIYDVDWALDSKSIYYPKWPELADEAKMVSDQTKRSGGIPVATHRLGDDPAKDQVVFDNPLLSTRFSMAEVPTTAVSAGKPNLLVAHRTKSGFMHRLAVLIGSKNTAGTYDWTELPHSSSALGRLVGVSSDWIYVMTSELGNQFGVLGYSTADTSKTKVMIPATSDLLLHAQRVGEAILAFYVDSSFKNFIRVYDLDGNQVTRFDYDANGLSALGTQPQFLNGTAWSPKVSFAYSSTDRAPVTIVFDSKTKKFEILKNAKEVPFNSSQGSNQVSSQAESFVASDGESIPVQVFQRTDLTTPKFVYLYYYGSNGVVNASSFNRKFQLMLELGGAVIAVGARGGGEKGARWYDAGMLDRTRSIADVIDAANWVRVRFNDSKLKVAASGRSYGGMLTNAVMTRASDVIDLFSPVVSIADLSYYMTDYFGSAGWDDLGYKRDTKGQIVDDQAGFDKMMDWSPFQNISRMKSLGAAILFTADSDERVGPHQTYLMTAALQDKFPTRPVYMFEQPKAGHMARAEMVDEAVFTALQFGLSDFKPIR